MAFTSRVENPGASATKVYWPAANTGKKNSPTAELWAENVLPVPLFVSVTLTPASKPPSLSCTWPDNCPPVCAKAARERAKTMEIARNVRKRLISYLPLNAHQIKSNVVHFWSKEKSERSQRARAIDRQSYRPRRPSLRKKHVAEC